MKTKLGFVAATLLLSSAAFAGPFVGINGGIAVSENINIATVTNNELTELTEVETCEYLYDKSVDLYIDTCESNDDIVSEFTNAVKSDRSTDDFGLNAALRFGWNFNEYFAVEGRYGKIVQDSAFSYAGAYATAGFPISKTLTPYAIGGYTVGFDVDNGGDYGSISYGFGLKFQPERSKFTYSLEYINLLDKTKSSNDTDVYTTGPNYALIGAANNARQIGQKTVTETVSTDTETGIKTGIISASIVWNF